MFRIKICGITNVEDAIAAVDVGADALGLNFYEKSPRCVTVQQARSITDACVDRMNDLLDEGLRSSLFYSVGVFVNHSADFICRAYDGARLVVAQLHGDEPATLLNELLEIPAIRVHRLGQGGLRAAGDDLNACKQVASANPKMKVATPCALLLDAASGGQFGGTGLTLPWTELVDYRNWLMDMPLILAGGLTPDNVAEAIRIVRPAAVDVASGVESSPGKKDPHKVRDFVIAARSAFESLES